MQINESQESVEADGASVLNNIVSGDYKLKEDKNTPITKIVNKVSFLRTKRRKTQQESTN